MKNIRKTFAKVALAIAFTTGIAATANMAGVFSPQTVEARPVGPKRVSYTYIKSAGRSFYWRRVTVYTDGSMSLGPVFYAKRYIG